ncbi:helix-turn-helix domain-containing protein [Streptomyces winkii]|uniref:helix-turn-helix domain-containing protein n=1 Tax=Streptomyces winkii TaxID=3051178 RepID=UPI0028D6A746|nr:XRE family transcriptional regulator [Streptomyces sp. DSM 40971]
MAEFDDVLDEVGSRLRALRTERGATLTALAKSTGISISTLSRLESGQRKPTLELLLPLARAHQVPLDELVGAPETGDPRVRARPIRRHGRTYVPLTRRPGGVQAFKVIVPPHDPPEPYEPKVHEGYEWIYVLSGQLHLVLGHRRLDLKPGEVVEFDTHTPHVIANRGGHPTEMLALFGPQGERMHVRTGT